MKLVLMSFSNSSFLLTVISPHKSAEELAAYTTGQGRTLIKIRGGGGGGADFFINIFVTIFCNQKNKNRYF